MSLFHEGPVWNTEPLAWLLDGVSQAKGMKTFLLPWTSLWTWVFLPSLAYVQEGALGLFLSIVPNVILGGIRVERYARGAYEKQDVFQVNKISENNGQRKAWEQQLGLDKDSLDPLRLIWNWNRLWRELFSRLTSSQLWELFDRSNISPVKEGEHTGPNSTWGRAH